MKKKVKYRNFFYVDYMSNNLDILYQIKCVTKIKVTCFFYFFMLRLENFKSRRGSCHMSTGQRVPESKARPLLTWHRCLTPTIGCQPGLAPGVPGLSPLLHRSVHKPKAFAGLCLPRVRQPSGLQLLPSCPASLQPLPCTSSQLPCSPYYPPAFAKLSSRYLKIQHV